MKIKNKFFVISMIPVVFLGVSVSLSSCASTLNDNRINITSAFYNSFDMLTTLGVIPQTQSIANKGLKLNYFPYMKEHIQEDKTKFEIFGTATSEANLLLLNSFKTHTLVLNEWDRTNEEKYLKDGIAAKNIAYTSMADSVDSKYSSKNKYYQKPGYKFDYKYDTSTSNYFSWHNYNEGTFSWLSALRMLARDLDKKFFVSPKIIEEKTISTFEDRVDYIEQKFVNNINDLRQQIQSEDSIFKGKNIGIFSGQIDGQGNYLPVDKDKNPLKHIQDPFMFSWIYGKEDIGMGFEFPKPKEGANNGITWADTGGTLAAISATDNAKLLENFKNKFDFIIYIASPNEKNLEIDINKVKKDYIDFKIDEYFKNTLKTEDKKNRFVPVNWLDWYPTAWSPIGVNNSLNQFISILNYFIKLNSNKTEVKFIEQKAENIWKPYAKEQLEYAILK